MPPLTVFNVIALYHLCNIIQSSPKNSCTAPNVIHATHLHRGSVRVIRVADPAVLLLLISIITFIGMLCIQICSKLFWSQA